MDFVARNFVHTYHISVSSFKFYKFDMNRVKPNLSTKYSQLVDLLVDTSVQGIIGYPASVLLF
jgi:hypothetical protein